MISEEKWVSAIKALHKEDLSTLKETGKHAKMSEEVASYCKLLKESNGKKIIFASEQEEKIVRIIKTESELKNIY